MSALFDELGMLDRHGILRRTTVLRHGLTDAHLANGIASGEVVHLGYGAYLPLACHGNFAQALTALDGALRLGASPAALTAELASRRRTGIAVARRALTFANGNAESVGESWSRAQFIVADLPLPQLQKQYRCRTRLPTVDFDWSSRLVGEFDGVVKYGRAFRRDGEGPAEVVAREKEREDQLRECGLMVLRWLWRDLETGAVVPLVRRWLTHFDLIR